MKVSDLKGSDLDRAVVESRPNEEYIKVKVSELIGPALDWAVAKCEGYTPKISGSLDIWVDAKDGGFVLLGFSRSWAQGGPVLDRNDIFPSRYYGAAAHCGKVYQATDSGHRMQGPTPLVAALRCYVASTIGAEIEIPVELANLNDPEAEIQHDDSLSDGPR